MRPRVILLAVLLAALALPAGWAVRDCASNPGACTTCSWDGDCAGFIYSPGMLTPEGVIVPPGQEIGYRSACEYFTGPTPGYYCVDFDLASPDPIDASYYVATAYYAQGQRLDFLVNNAVPDLVPTCDTAGPNVWTNPTPVCWHAPTISDCAADCDPCPLDPLYIAAGSCLAEGGNTLGGTCSCCGGLVPDPGTGLCRKPHCGEAGTRGLPAVQTSGVAVNGGASPAFDGYFTTELVAGYCCSRGQYYVAGQGCTDTDQCSEPLPTMCGPKAVGQQAGYWSDLLCVSPVQACCPYLGGRYGVDPYYDYVPVVPY